MKNYLASSPHNYIIFSNIEKMIFFKMNLNILLEKYMFWANFMMEPMTLCLTLTGAGYGIEMAMQSSTPTYQAPLLIAGGVFSGYVSGFVASMGYPFFLGYGTYLFCKKLYFSFKNKRHN